MWTRTSTCRPNGYGFTAPYPYEVTAGGAAAGELLGGVTVSPETLPVFKIGRVGKGLTRPSRARSMGSVNAKNLVQVG